MIGNAADLTTYAAARGVNLDEAQAPVYLTKATDYLNGKQWVGDQVGVDCWPRTGIRYTGAVLIGEDGLPIVADKGTIIDAPVTPQNVITSAYRLAIAVSEGVDLEPVYAGSQVVEERVEGVVDVKYSEGSLGAAPYFPWFDGLCAPWLDSSGLSMCQVRVGAA